MKIQTRIKTQKIKIGDLFFKLGIEPRPENMYLTEFDLKVKTPYGFKPIVTLFTTERQPSITTTFSNGESLNTSEHHLFKTENREWVKAEELTSNDIILTEEGVTRVSEQVVDKKEKVMYDLSVADVFCYYSNGILSHNSWMMVAMAAHAVKMGYNVVYYTLELGQDYVGKRFDCYFTGHSIEEIQHHRSEVERIVEGLAGKLIVKEYPPKGATVSTLKSHLQKCIDADVKPDLVIIDYIDYLRAPSKKFAERKDEIDDLYVSCKGLAKEFKVTVLSPSQVNRMGAKDDIIEGDKAAGSYDKIMVADFCLSLSRKKEDKVHGTGRVHIMKNRYGMDGMTFGAKIDTNNGHIELTEDMPTYEDTSSNSTTSFSQVDSFDKRELAKKFAQLSNFS
jgi:hypothetical protein